MKIKRRRQEQHTGLVVRGGGRPEKNVPTIGAGIAVALMRAHRLAVGEHVAVLEYGEEIGRAVRTQEGTSWQ